MRVAVADVATVATPCGPFLVLAVDEVVVASGWTGDVTRLAGCIPSDSRPARWRDRRDLGPITAAVRAYLAGDLEAIGAIPVGQRSGPFVEAAWVALRAVPPGSPVTYRALAGRCGRPAAARAAGLACHRNATALFVPCHRAVRGDGGLGGFRWGVVVKQWLLAHEATWAGSDSDAAVHGVVGPNAPVDEVLLRL